MPVNFCCCDCCSCIHFKDADGNDYQVSLSSDTGLWTDQSTDPVTTITHDDTNWALVTPNGTYISPYPGHLCPSISIGDWTTEDGPDLTIVECKGCCINCIKFKFTTTDPDNPTEQADFTRVGETFISTVYSNIPTLVKTTVWTLTTHFYFNEGWQTDVFTAAIAGDCPPTNILAYTHISGDLTLIQIIVSDQPCTNCACAGAPGGPGLAPSYSIVGYFDGFFTGCPDCPDSEAAAWNGSFPLYTGFVGVYCIFGDFADTDGTSISGKKKTQTFLSLHIDPGPCSWFITINCEGVEIWGGTKLYGNTPAGRYYRVSGCDTTASIVLV